MRRLFAHWPALWVWCLLSLPAHSFTTPLQDPAPTLEEGLRLLGEDRPEAALRQFAAFKTAHPGDARSYYYSAVALLRLGQQREAAAELQAALRLDPGSARAALLYAEVLSGLGHEGAARDALVLFEEPTVRQELEPPRLWQLSDLYYRLDRLDEALAVLDELAGSQAGGPGVEQRRAEILLALSRFEEASEAFGRVLASDENSAPAHYGLGLAEWRLGKLDEALGHLERAVQLAPESTPSIYQLGLLLADLGRFEEALARLSSIAPRGAEMPEIYGALSRVHRRLGNREDARAFLEQFEAAQQKRQEERDRNRQVERLLAQASGALREGRISEARGLLLEAVAADARNGTAQAYLAKIYLSSRRWADAERHLVALESIRGDDFEVHFLWAQFHRSKDRPQEALRRAEAALRLRPADGELHNLLGNLYLDLGRERDALVAYRTAVSLSPDRKDFRLNLEVLERRLQPR